jgi:hypothetical protein
MHIIKKRLSLVKEEKTFKFKPTTYSNIIKHPLILTPTTSLKRLAPTVIKTLQKRYKIIKIINNNSNKAIL